MYFSYQRYIPWCSLKASNTFAAISLALAEEITKASFEQSNAKVELQLKLLILLEKAFGTYRENAVGVGADLSEADVWSKELNQWTCFARGHGQTGDGETSSTGRVRRATHSQPLDLLLVQAARSSPREICTGLTPA